MLLEFRVTNYRSIKDTQVLSMVASPDKSLLTTNCISSNINSIPYLTRSVVMYGANASGKSNVILAMASMRNIIANSFATMLRAKDYISTFRFSAECKSEPTEFEMTFIENGVRYQYGFALTADQITKEWLLAYPKSQPQRWFEREYDNKNKTYHWYFGSHFTEQKNLIPSWKEQTRPNALFFSTAIHLNSSQLRPLFDWFIKKLVIVGANSFLDPAFTIKYASEDSAKKSKIIQLAQAADLGIVDFDVESIKGKGKRVSLRFEEGVPSAPKVEDADVLKITLIHQGKNKIKVGFNITEESHGTQRFFAYSGPILDILSEGKVLVVDELDSSFHTKMVRFLIGLFHSKKLNRNNAQLIFSTHNTSLLDTDLFRRDQIWFLEKDQNQASHLYPLTDFSPRKKEDLEKGYLLGRYSALPFFGEINF